MNKYYLLLLVLFAFSCHPKQEEYSDKARLLLKQGQFDNCIEIVNEAINHYPEDPELHNLKGVANFELGSLNEAVSNFNASINLDSSHYKPHYNLGNCFFALKEFGQAIDHFNHAIQLNPKIPELYINLGNSYFEREEYRKSLIQFEFAVKLDSTSYLGYMNSARAHIAMEDYRVAEAPLQKCISIKPENGEAYFYLAYVNLLLGKNKDEYCLLLAKSKELGFHPPFQTLDDMCF